VNKDGYKTNVTMFSGEEAAEKCSGKSVRWAKRKHWISLKWELPDRTHRSVHAQWVCMKS